MTKENEWLITNEQGAFAMGTPSRLYTRKYHGLLTTRLFDQEKNLIHIVSELNEKIILEDDVLELGSFHYDEGVDYPHGFDHLIFFSPYPNPTWTYKFKDVIIIREISLDPWFNQITINYSFSNVPKNSSISIYPYFTSRNAHKLSCENMILNGGARLDENKVFFKFYKTCPEIFIRHDTDCSFEQDGFWNLKVRYPEERQRGYHDHEDLYCPGYVSKLVEENCNLSMTIGIVEDSFSYKSIRDANKKSDLVSFVDHVKKSADDFLIQSPKGRKSIVAGYPWFGEWGRDTFISLPGLTLARGNFEMAKHIIDSYKNCLKEGLIPNILSVDTESHDGHSIDATLWCIHAIQMLEEYAGYQAVKPYQEFVFELLNNLLNFPSNKIKVEESGLLYANAGNRALTWMDASVNGQAVTPRSPYSVEVNALFYNDICYALTLAKRVSKTTFIEIWKPISQHLKVSFREMFWLHKEKYLMDCHDGDKGDKSLRPNQLIAVSVPYSPITKKMGKSILKHIQEELLTPYGLRTLSPLDLQYQGKCVGTQEQRDFSYHQGTIWPWLIGPYMDAVFYIHGPNKYLKEYEKFEKVFQQHLSKVCSGQISEIFDGDAPHEARGAPAQAWSVAEILRVAIKAEELKHNQTFFEKEISSQVERS